MHYSHSSHFENIIFDINLTNLNLNIYTAVLLNLNEFKLENLYKLIFYITYVKWIVKCCVLWVVYQNSKSLQYVCSTYRLRIIFAFALRILVCNIPKIIKTENMCGKIMEYKCLIIECVHYGQYSVPFIKAVKQYNCISITIRSAAKSDICVRLRIIL